MTNGLADWFDFPRQTLPARVDEPELGQRGKKTHSILNPLTSGGSQSPVHAYRSQTPLPELHLRESFVGGKIRCGDWLFGPRCQLRAFLGQKVPWSDFQAVFCELGRLMPALVLSLADTPHHVPSKTPHLLGSPVVKSRGRVCIGRRKSGVLRVAARGVN